MTAENLYWLEKQQHKDYAKLADAITTGIYTDTDSIMTDIYTDTDVPEFKKRITKTFINRFYGIKADNFNNIIDKKEINKMPPKLFAFNEPLYLNFTVSEPHGYFEIKKVIFNNPATIVYWADGTKTVVKCGEDDVFDEEKGLAMAISKRALGNSGHYYEMFKKWLPEEEIIDPDIDLIKNLAETFKRINGYGDKEPEKEQNDNKKTSCYDWFKKHYPKGVNKSYCGGCLGCPGDYFEGLPTNAGEKCAVDNCCEECWKTNYVIEE